MNISTRTNHSGLVEIAVSGDIDVATAPSLYAAIIDRFRTGSTVVVLKLADVTFFDATALNALLRCQREATHDRSAQLVLASLSPFVRRVLDLTGTTEQFTYQHPTR